MSSKYKVTGCARFFLVLIILAPLAYLGASYYNGQDGIENVKKLIGIGDSDSDSQTKVPEKAKDSEAKEELPSTKNSVDDAEKQSLPATKKEDTSNDQSERINELTKENAKLKKDHEDILRRIIALEEENKALKTKQDTTG